MQGDLNGYGRPLGGNGPPPPPPDVGSERAPAVQQAYYGRPLGGNGPPPPPPDVGSERAPAVQQAYYGRPLGGNGPPPPPPDVGSERAPVVQQAYAARPFAEEEQTTDPGAIGVKEPDYSDRMEGRVDPPQSPTVEPAPDLDNQTIYRIIRQVVRPDSGENPYSAIATDPQPGGGAPGSGPRRRFGLSYGLALFTQESGRLGSVLKYMHDRDPGQFAEIFGPDWQELLAVTNAARSEERLRPVGGHPLWEEPWLERFRRAGTVEAFRAAQNQEAIEGQFRPMIRVATALGFRSFRGLAMIYDRVVTKGLGAGLSWVVSTAGPLKTDAQRAHALSLLGHQSVESFQGSVEWLSPTGRFGPETHAALVGALRRDGRVPLPTSAQLEAALLEGAEGAARTRLDSLVEAWTDPSVPAANPRVG